MILCIIVSQINRGIPNFFSVVFNINIFIMNICP
uniref:Uncharacterized protein n=1 Tax=virus sp. ctrcb4 TaxID=2825824 RepID=A0A8S5RPN2_9VIRU|nr:MAG TPA: hypothetical protein [virus sp. ctrcb4]